MGGYIDWKTTDFSFYGFFPNSVELNQFTAKKNLRESCYRDVRIETNIAETKEEKCY